MDASDQPSEANRNQLAGATRCRGAARPFQRAGAIAHPCDLLSFGPEAKIHKAAAREKGIASPVAGRADILVAPDLVLGNILAEQRGSASGWLAWRRPQSGHERARRRQGEPR
jgi:hypothetical protein